MIKAAIDSFKHRPLFGYGIGNFSVISEFDMYAHNNYVELLADLGSVGFLIYYAMYFYLFFKLSKGVFLKENDLVFPFIIVVLIMISETGLVSYNVGYIQILLVLSYSWLKIHNKLKIDGEKVL
ncbi:O-antigen ligase family protein [Paenibacillus protaetiae]|uniref:O-antigen ligase-related domain-containing protein n=1 Tax=Paenibacillus protaetiae TaxID=2509456 RepID=A0A4P6EYI2_9BACL|nr:O-antigen ligase family protein [Paenibacillus protaetiae]QAY67785.1 hypothetical protein ET464_16710 [Paenibacillus protaetiae]